MGNTVEIDMYHTRKYKFAISALLSGISLAVTWVLGRVKPMYLLVDPNSSSPFCAAYTFNCVRKKE